jgi:uncharacterized membrane protein
MSTSFSSLSTSTPTKPRACGAKNRRNVGGTERLLSIGGGLALAMTGMSSRSPRGLALALMGGGLLYRGITGHCHAYDALGVHTNDPDSEQASIPAAQGVHIIQSVTIRRPADELYTFWRDFKNLQRFMKHVDEVIVLDASRSKWKINTPLGFVEWEAEIVTDTPGETISWQSVEGSRVGCAGSVRFKELPAKFGTQVDVNLRYDGPGGRAGAFLASLFGQSPEQYIREDLRRFKQLMETGEIPTTEGQPTGQCC